MYSNNILLDDRQVVLYVFIPYIYDMECKICI